MRNDFNNQAEAFFDPNARIVNIPAHIVIDVDYWSVQEDARGGGLKGWTTADIEKEYGTERLVPAQAVAFTSWDKLPSDLPDKTKALLKQALEDDERSTPDPLKGRVVLSKVLRFRKDA